MAPLAQRWRAAARSMRPYRGLLALSFASRLPLGMAGVGLLALALARGLGPGIGGTAVGCYALSFAVAGPWLGRRTQVRGPHRVLTECLVGQLVACVLLVLALSPPVFLLSAALLGLTTPPLAAIMRATWNRLFETDARAAGQLAVVETLNTEGVHIVGRIAVAALAVVGAAMIPVAYGVLMLVGLLRLRADPRLVPPPRVRHDRTGARMWNAATVGWGAVMLAMATSHGAAATTMVTSATPSGGWQGPAVMAVWGVGSLVGGAVVLARGDLAGPLPTAAIGSVAFAAVAAASAWLQATGLALMALVFLLGVPISSMVSAVFRGSEPAAPAARQVELFAFYTSLSFLGFSAGSALAGWVVEGTGLANSGFVVASAASMAVLPPLLVLATVGPRHVAGAPPSV